MYEVLDVVVVALIGFVLYFLNHLKGSILEIEGRLNATIENIAQNEYDLPSLNGLKDEVLDIVESTIENLTPPTAIDHIAGAVSQYFQMKLMKEMNGFSAPMELVDKAKDIADTVQDIVSND
jgi:hypothetical protein